MATPDDPDATIDDRANAADKLGETLPTLPGEEAGATMDDQAARARTEEYLSSPDMTRVSAPKQPEQVLKMMGQYALHRELGRGAMGVVYEATDTKTQKRVAVKVLPPGLGQTGSAKERFIREGEAMSALRHPNILPVYGLGEAEGTVFYAMQIVGGDSLKEVIEEQGVPFKDAARFVRDAADALDYAHDAGVIHRDIKPANLLIEDDGGERKVMVADFGIAKSAEHATLTASGTVMGTPMYMSPEQAKGETSGLDGRSDVYSLGATLYEALTGAKPYTGQDVQTILRHVIETDPPAPRRINPEVPKPLEAIALKAMEKRRDRRYATAADMAEDLDRYLKGQPVHARVRGPIARAMRWAARHKAAAALIFLIVVGTLGGGGTFAFLQWQHAKKIRTTLESASAALSAGELDKAAGLFKAVDTLEPGNVLAKSGAESVAVRRRELAAEAERAAAKAARAAAVQLTEQADAAVRGGAPDTAGRIAELKRAEELALKAIEKDPTYDGARKTRVTIALARAHLEVTRDRYEDARIFLALARDSAGDDPSAVAELDRLDRIVAGTGTLAVTTVPAGAIARLRRADPTTRVYGAPQELGRTPVAARDLPMGSYQLELRLDGHAVAHWPFVVARNQAVAPAIPLVPANLVPAGMVHVPAGASLIGDPVRGDMQLQQFPAFLVDRTEVTREAYAKWLAAIKDTDPEQYRQSLSVNVRSGKPLWEPENFEEFRRTNGANVPVVGIPWTAATAYADWRNARLPTREEWERVARGADGRLYPWGDRFDVKRLNCLESSESPSVLAAETNPAGASPFGVLNMAGNVSEFTASAIRSVEVMGRRREIIEVRGGMCASNNHDVMTAVAQHYSTVKRSMGLGFRCVADLPKQYGGTK